MVRVKGLRPRNWPSAEESGLSVSVFSFPGYAKNVFGEAIGRYLNGEFGDVDAVAPQLASLLYAGDRFATSEDLRRRCREQDLVLCDRYVPSNLAHQAAKLPRDQREAFLSWITHIEYGIYGVPRPDLVVYLDVPVEWAIQLVRRKKARDYTQLKADIHEKNEDYLYRCRNVYVSLAQKNHGGPWVTVPCTTLGGELLSPEEVNTTVWQTIVRRLHGTP